MSQRLGTPCRFARKIRRCCRDAAAMPTICRCRPARCTPMSSARRIRTPTSCSIDAAAALAKDGVWAVITGDDVKQDFRSVPGRAEVADAPMVARGRARALSSASRWRWWWRRAAISPRTPPSWSQIEYAPLEAVIDPLAACKPSAPLLHAEAKTNEISVRKFHYGDTKSAFEQADKVVKLTVDFHRLSFTPMECYVAVADAQSGRRQLRLHGEFPGAVQHASGDGAGAARAGAEDAAAHSARLAAAASASSFRCFPTWC